MDSEEEKGKKLYIAGVSWSTTDDGFMNFFARMGDIHEAIVMRDRNGKSRGFGFVTFKDPAVAERLHGQTLMLDGRKLDIMDAIPRNEMINAVKSQPSKKLYVAGVSWNTTDDGLYNFFSRFGTVMSAQVQRDRPNGKSRGFGFVTFDDPTSAEKVISEQNLTLDGRKLEIKSAIPRGLVGTIEAERQARPKKIFVAGLSENVTDGDLRDHFSHYGRVVEAIIQKDRGSGVSRGFGFVTFDDGDSVDKVLLKGSQKLGDKCVVDVKIARPKDSPLTEGAPPGASVWSSSFGTNSGPGSWGPPPSSWGPPHAPSYSSWGPPPPPPTSSSQYHPPSPYQNPTSQYGAPGSHYSSSSTQSYSSPYSQQGSTGWNNTPYGGSSGWNNTPGQTTTTTTPFNNQFQGYGAFRRARAPVPRASYHPYQR